MWTKDVREKLIGGYKIRRKRNGYSGEKKHENGKVDRWEIWRSISTDKGWRDEDITPFLTQVQKDMKTHLDKMSKMHYDNMVYSVRKNYKKKTGKDISNAFLKKKIKSHSEIEGRKLEISTAIEDIKKERNLEEEYKDAKFFVDEATGRRMCELKNKTLKMDEDLLLSDSSIGVIQLKINEQHGTIPEGMTVEEMWEIYGDISDIKTIDEVEVKEDESK